MKRNSTVLLLVIVSLMVTYSSNAAEINMKEGLWEITSKMEVPGMPFPMPPTTHSQCITEKDMVPQGKDAAEQGCTMVEKSIDNNIVSWTMNCSKDGMVSKSTGSITYNGTTFDGTVNMTTGNPMSGRNMEMKTVMKGKYIGECK